QIRQGCLASFVSKRSLATRSPADTADGPMAKDAAPSSPGVQFLVLALSEGESEHRWKGSCALAAPLSQLAKKWATFHQVPESSVGLELKGKELDLQKSPADYSLDTNAQVELLCFPKEEDFMEPQAEASRGERRRNREKARPEATSKPEKAKEEPEAKEKEAKGKKRRAEVKVENKAEPKKRERAGSRAQGMQRQVPKLRPQSPPEREEAWWRTRTACPASRSPSSSSRPIPRRRELHPSTATRSTRWPKPSSRHWRWGLPRGTSSTTGRRATSRSPDGMSPFRHTPLRFGV
ncbi:unnamed protein product, partial [Effrenium voratum]